MLSDDGGDMQRLRGERPCLPCGAGGKGIYFAAVSACVATDTVDCKGSFEMKKTAVVILFAVLVGFVLSLSAGAWDTPLEESIAEKAGDISADSPYLSAQEKNGDKPLNIFEKAYTVTLDALKSGGLEITKSTGVLLGILVLCSVLGAVKGLSSSRALATGCELVSVLALSGTVYHTLYRCVLLVTCSMESLSLAVSSLLPVMSGLYAFGGNPATAAASHSLLMLFLTAISFLCTKVILPLLKISFGFALTGAMPGSIDLSPLGSAVKNVCTVGLSFLFSLLSFSLWYQTAITAAGDTLVTRSVRFASGAFVPVIGGILGECSRTIMASVGVIRSTVGSVGAVMTLGAVIPPVISVLLHRLMLMLLSALAKTLGCVRESRFLADVSSCFGVLLALVLGAGSVVLIALAVFIKIGTGG